MNRKGIDKTRTLFLKEIEQNEFLRKKHKKVCTDLNCFEHFLILATAITRCISISAFAFWIHVPIGITSFAVKLKVFEMAPGIKKYKSIIKKKEKNHDKIFF